VGREAGNSIPLRFRHGLGWILINAAATKKPSAKCKRARRTTDDSGAIGFLDCADRQRSGKGGNPRSEKVLAVSDSTQPSWPIGRRMPNQGTRDALRYWD